MQETTTENFSEAAEAERPESKKKWYKKWWGIFIILLGISTIVLLSIFAGLTYYYYQQIKSGRMPLPASAKFSSSKTQVSQPSRIDSRNISPAGEPNSSPGAPLTITGFFDFQCPFSKEGSGIMRELQTIYGDKVNFVFRNFPLVEIHPEAMLAAQAGECANLQDKFWPMHDKLFASQSLDEATLNLYAQQVGLDSVAFSECLKSSQSNGLVLKDILDGQVLGIRGTPTWFVNNEKIEGVAPSYVFQRIINSLLTEKNKQPTNSQN